MQDVCNRVPIFRLVGSIKESLKLSKINQICTDNTLQISVPLRPCQLSIIFLNSFCNFIILLGLVVLNLKETCVMVLHTTLMRLLKNGLRACKFEISVKTPSEMYRSCKDLWQNTSVRIYVCLRKYII